MNLDLTEHPVACPYCWETFSILLDSIDGIVEYIEDCQVCCHPIQFRITLEPEDKPQIQFERAM